MAKPVIQAQPVPRVQQVPSVLLAQLATKGPRVQQVQLVYKEREVILVIPVTPAHKAQPAKQAEWVPEAKQETRVIQAHKAHPDNKAQLEDRDSRVRLAQRDHKVPKARPELLEEWAQQVREEIVEQRVRMEPRVELAPQAP